jgi:hypothetical protein
MNFFLYFKLNQIPVEQVCLHINNRLLFNRDKLLSTFYNPNFYRVNLSFNIEEYPKFKKIADNFRSILVCNNSEIKALQSSIFAIPIPTITYNFRF